ncbi:MAG: N-acetyltransferase [Gemmatimonadales bacterium]
MALVTPAVRIRRATPDDAEVLAELAERIFLDTFAAQNKREDIELHVKRRYAAEIQRRELEQPEKTYLIVEADGVPVGFAFLGKAESRSCLDFAAPIELFRFYLDKAWHGAGIAQALMVACEDEARSRGGRTICLSVWEHNPRAIRFYEKTGFRDAGTQPFLLGEDVQTDRLMVRDLAVVGIPVA